MVILSGASSSPLSRSSSAGTAAAPEASGAATLFDKLWARHVISELDGGVSLLQVDRHVLQEVSSAAAFQALRKSGRAVAAPRQNFATQDHIISTAPGRTEASFPPGIEYVQYLRKNCADFGIQLFDIDDPRQGIVHIIAAELGIALPGCTLVCGDSHTATLGGLGALAWGVGTSEVGHVLATQTLTQTRPRPMKVHVSGRLPAYVTAKDIILHIIRSAGISGGVGYAIEYAGSAMQSLSIEGRMTICNMSIELGARFGFVAPDEATFDYLHGRPLVPQGADWDQALHYWRTLQSDDAAVFAKTIELNVDTLSPQISWGTTPGDVIDIDEPVPHPGSFAGRSKQDAMAHALDYMDLRPGQSLAGLPIDRVFLGSCTNARLSDLQLAARAIRGRTVAPGVVALVVPGSGAVKRAAEAEGLDRIFRAAGFEWREPGCSMCLGINDDQVPPGARCVSTSNRNFEGRQGPGARTHIASPLTAIAAALHGCITDPRTLF
jgi:3-isopropylmalate/(R)-2-methylmalate dehydratase large subunit